MNHYQTEKEARYGLTNYFTFYNTERLHSSLGYSTPEEIYNERERQDQVQDQQKIHLNSYQFLS
ncbi:MAG: integrase core domain-containing protein [Candidatus Glassbacteria bacterium]